MGRDPTKAGGPTPAGGGNLAAAPPGPPLSCALQLPQAWTTPALVPRLRVSTTGMTHLQSSSVRVADGGPTGPISPAWSSPTGLPLPLVPTPPPSPCRRLPRGLGLSRLASSTRRRDAGRPIWRLHRRVRFCGCPDWNTKTPLRPSAFAG